VSSINLKELAKGIDLCIENATGLIEETRLLFDKNRFPRCFSLCVLAVEEIGKIEVVARGALIRETEGEEWKRFRKDFKSHEMKQAHAIVMHFAQVRSSEGSKGLRRRFRSSGRFTLDRAKQLGLYVDLVDSKFVSPHTMISRKLAREALNRAEETLGRYDGLPKGKNLELFLAEFQKSAPDEWKTDQELMALRRILNELHQD